jgi:ubiquinone/menaquinone biosynthesis C-methylase UbiE
VSLARFVVRQLARLAAERPGRRLANASINSQALELLDLSPGDRVLEVGFGGGGALANIIGRAGMVAAIDPSEASVRAARRRFGEELRSGRLRIERATVEATPFEADSFDCVLSVNTIYFWADPDRGLREIHRVLKPGGRLVLATETRPGARVGCTAGLRVLPAERASDHASWDGNRVH